MTPAGEGQTPEEILRSTPPLDDVGAATADRYEWQAMMAAADALSIYFSFLDESGELSQGAQCTMLCEHHEDWSVAKNGSTEIVSAKHRETSTGPLSSYRQVLTDGGVLHLFKRWIALEQTPECRLVTTSGLAGDGAKIDWACKELRDKPTAVDAGVDVVVTGLKSVMETQLDAEDAKLITEGDEVLRTFLASLRFQIDQPRRDLVPELAGERYGRPVSERLGQPDAGFAVWTAVLAVVRPRMRAAGPARGGGLPTVLGVDHDDSLAPRTLAIADIDTAIRLALRHSVDYTPLPRRVKENRMAVKMTQGGCSDNAVERADELRLQYGRYSQARRSAPDPNDSRGQIGNTLRRVVDEATDNVRTEDGPWGAELWRELGRQFRRLEGQAEAQGLSTDLLLGGVSELANNCQVWFTDRFDIDAVLSQLIAKQAAS